MKYGLGTTTRGLYIIVAAVIATISAVVAWSVFGASSIGLYSSTASTEPADPITEEDQTRSTVPLDQIVSGGPPRDGIPSIDNAKFVSTQEASKYLQDGDQI